MTDKLLSAQQVADYLGIHVKTLYKLLRENKIALNYVRVHGRMIAFRPAAVELYVSTHEVARDGSGIGYEGGQEEATSRMARDYVG